MTEEKLDPAASGDFTSATKTNKSVRPLPPENLEIAPYGDPKCRICQLPLEDLKKIHFLKLEDGYSYKKMREYLKEHYKIGNDYTYLTRHFKEHVRSDKASLLLASSPNKAVVEVLLTHGRGLGTRKTDADIERNYDRLVQMSSDFLQQIEKCYKVLRLKMSDEAALEKELSERTPLELLNTVASLNRTVREQMKDINALRAPKLVVMQFLEDTIDKSISEVNETLTQMFTITQAEFTEFMRKQGIAEYVNDRVFVDIFKRVAMAYRERMTLLRRDQLNRASAALASLEKVL